MSKYIIKNCPAFDYKYNECHSKIGNHKLYCMDCTDCILKQIVEKCKTKIEDDICLNCNDFETQRTFYECDYEHHREDIYHKRADVCFAQQIIPMLEIKECEDE